jgi:TldD protein
MHQAQYVDEAVMPPDQPRVPPGPGRRDDRGAGPGWPGILLHEAIGHGLEGDFNRKGSSAFSGRIGQRVAAKGVTVLDDGTMPTAAARSTWTTKATPASATC